MATKKVISFDISKNERFQLSDNYKLFHRKIKNQWKVEQNEGELKLETLKNVKIFVLAGPQDRFTEEEFGVLKEFIEGGGSLFVMLGEGGESSYNTNVNFFLEQYGIFINNDTVIRTHYYKNFHPKEATVGGGVVCESMAKHLLKQPIEQLDFHFSDEKLKIHFQYPYGASLNVSEPANILLLTGTVVYPFNRPIAAYCVNEKGGGKILATGSGFMWHDKYLSDKTNDAMLDYFLNLLGTDEIKFNHLDFNDIEVNEAKTFMDIGFVADLPKACLVDTIGAHQKTPSDFKQLFNMKLCRLSNCLLVDVIATYKQLKVTYEPLKIIKPQFEIPLPPLQLATFPPVFSEPPAPPLELYDLDEIFSPPRTRLALLTSQVVQSIEAKNLQKPTNDKEIENCTKLIKNYIKECAEIVGGIIIDGQDMPPLEIMNVVLQRICNYKPYEDE